MESENYSVAQIIRASDGKHTTNWIDFFFYNNIRFRPSILAVWVAGLRTCISVKFRKGTLHKKININWESDSFWSFIQYLLRVHRFEDYNKNCSCQSICCWASAWRQRAFAVSWCCEISVRLCDWKLRLNLWTHRHFTVFTPSFLNDSLLLLEYYKYIKT